MLMFKTFIIAVFFLQNVLGLRKVYCDNEDEACLSKAVADRVFPKLLEGIPGVDCSEPLHLPRLEINLPYLKNYLINVTMTGVKDCELKFKKNTADTLFHYKSRCPRLTIDSEYEANGKVDGVTVKGRGTFKITYENYFMDIAGSHVKMEYSDCKQHIRILNYTIHSELKGKSSYDFQNLVFGNSGSCKCKPSLRSRYYDRFEEIIRTPLMDAFVNKFMENVRDFHTAVPVEELYYQYV